MSEKTAIEWADSTFNPWVGCTKVSPACDNCYAERQDARGIFGGPHWGAGVPRKRTGAANWRKPVAWNAQPFYQCPQCRWRGIASGPHAACPNCPCPTLFRARRRVFCASLADVFDNEVPTEWRRDLFALIADTPHLDWLLLTKRIGNVMRMVAEIADNPRMGSHSGDLMAHHWRNGTPPPNVRLGATIVNQEEADRDIPKLMQVPAAVRFLSMEPLLGPVSFEGMFASRDVRDGTNMLEELDWVIVGGESGPKARPMHPDWVRSLRDQCAAADVPFFMKQMGGHPDKRGTLEGLPEDLRVRNYP